jgi:hypothetical protein
MLIRLEPLHDREVGGYSYRLYMLDRFAIFSCVWRMVAPFGGVSVVPVLLCEGYPF